MGYEHVFLKVLVILWGRFPILDSFGFLIYLSSVKYLLFGINLIMRFFIRFNYFNYLK